MRHRSNRAQTRHRHHHPRPTIPVPCHRRHGGDDRRPDQRRHLRRFAIRAGTRPPRWPAIEPDTATGPQSEGNVRRTRQAQVHRRPDRRELRRLPQDDLPPPRPRHCGPTPARRFDRNHRIAFYQTTFRTSLHFRQLLPGPRLAAVMARDRRRLAGIRRSGSRWRWRGDAAQRAGIAGQGLPRPSPIPRAPIRRGVRPGR